MPTVKINVHHDPGLAQIPGVTLEAGIPTAATFTRTVELPQVPRMGERLQIADQVAVHVGAVTRDLTGAATLTTWPTIPGEITDAKLTAAGFKKA